MINRYREATRQGVDMKTTSGSKQLLNLSCFKNQVRKLDTSAVYPTVQGKKYRRPKNKKNNGIKTILTRRQSSTKLNRSPVKKCVSRSEGRRPGPFDTHIHIRRIANSTILWCDEQLLADCVHDGLEVPMLCPCCWTVKVLIAERPAKDVTSSVNITAALLLLYFISNKLDPRWYHAVVSLIPPQDLSGIIFKFINYYYSWSDGSKAYGGHIDGNRAYHSTGYDANNWNSSLNNSKSVAKYKNDTKFYDL